MLKLVTNLRRSINNGHHLHLFQYYPTEVGSSALASPLWQQHCFRHHQHLVATNTPLVFIRASVHHKPALSSGCSRGLATSTASEQPSSGIIAWYLRMLSMYPLPTKMITAANILSFADMTAQYLANTFMLKEGESKQDWDKMRTLRMTGIGAFLSAPFLHMWFNVMQRILPSSDVATIVKKVLIGQLLASPIVNSAFFAINSFLQGENLEQAIEKIKRDLWPTWKSGAMYWPILDFITFRYIKVHLQVFFNNCCSFIWTIYLTSMAGKKAEAPSPEQRNHIEMHKPC